MQRGRGRKVTDMRKKVLVHKPDIERIPGLMAGHDTVIICNIKPHCALLATSEF